MSYSFENMCHLCNKENDCADGKIIAGAINTIHTLAYHPEDNSCHKGCGSVKLSCDNFEDK